MPISNFGAGLLIGLICGAAMVYLVLSEKR